MFNFPKFTLIVIKPCCSYDKLANTKKAIYNLLVLQFIHYVQYKEVNAKKSARKEQVVAKLPVLFFGL